MIAIKNTPFFRSCVVPYPAVGPRGMARRVGGRGGGCAASGVSLGEAATGADLGGSSKYSNESFED